MRLMNRQCILGLLAVVLLMAAPSSAYAKKAIVLASFGTTYPTALQSILNIKQKVEQAFPNTPVRLAFTSNMVRARWKKRRKDPKWLNNQDIPREILFVKGPLATIADLQDEGYKNIAVQSLHVFAGEQFSDLKSYIYGLNLIKTIKPKYNPFKKLILGRPALGMPGRERPYQKDLKQAAMALKKDVDMAEKKEAALVYMGHGNHYYSTGVFLELEEMMRDMYPNVPIFIGMVEGFPSLERVLKGLKKQRTKKAVLFPLMVVAGDHARNDMAGKDDDSWKNTLERNGINVQVVMRGLGELDSWANIYLNHLNDAIDDNRFKEE